MFFNGRENILGFENISSKLKIFNVVFLNGNGGQTRIATKYFQRTYLKCSQNIFCNIPIYKYRRIIWGTLLDD